MANRQHGRGRSPSGSRSPAGGRSPAASRSARAMPASRSLAGGRSPSGSRSPGGGSAPGDWNTEDRQRVWTPSRPGTPAFVEPEVRRWPHPLTDGTPSPAPGPEPALHYIRCALSYQNQLLADIKALLEQLAAEAAQSEEAPRPEERDQG